MAKHGKIDANNALKAKAITPSSQKYLFMKEKKLILEYEELRKEIYPDQSYLKSKEMKLSEIRNWLSLPCVIPSKNKTRATWANAMLLKIGGKKEKMFFESGMIVDKHELSSDCSFLTKESPLGQILWNQQVGFKIKFNGVNVEILEIYTYEESHEWFFPVYINKSKKVETAA